MHEVLRLMPYGIYAIGVGSKPNQQNAFIASWATQCSFEPALFLIAIRKGTINQTLIEKGQAFSVSFMNKEQTELARQLVKPHHQVGDKLGQISHFEEVTGAPILKEAFAYIECRLVSQATQGDHLIVVGEVVNAGLIEPKEPLLCNDIGWTYAG